jgi:hypothetical protein
MSDTPVILLTDECLARLNQRQRAMHAKLTAAVEEVMGRK